jgi:hypothetical protein
MGKKKRIMEKCPYCGARMKQAHLEDHKELDCPKRPVPCPLECGTTMCYDDLDGMKQHQEEDCYMRYVPCKWDCGKGNLAFKDQAEHEASECPRREIECHNKPCPEKVVAEEQEEHDTNCKYRMVDCELSCGKTLFFCDMEVHMAKRCLQRQVTCKWEGCGMNFIAANGGIWKQHEIHECEEREVRCVYKCGIQNLKAKNYDAHVLKCNFRPEPCSYKCGHVGPFCKLEHHINTNCPNVFPNGTRFSVLYKSLADTPFFGTVTGIEFGKGQVYRVKWDPIDKQDTPYVMEFHGKDEVSYAESKVALYRLDKDTIRGSVGKKLIIMGGNYDIKRLTKKLWQPLEGELISVPEQELDDEAVAEPEGNRSLAVKTIRTEAKSKQQAQAVAAAAAATAAAAPATTAAVSAVAVPGV